MSGGVDSSVAACLLKEQGYECVGVFMRVGASGEGVAAEPRVGRRSHGAAKPRGDEGRSAGALRGAPKSSGESDSEHAAPGARRKLKHGCCSVADALDARAVASRLGIPFYVLNFEPEFERIIAYFADEYARARTPNPCVRCNIDLKFGKLLRYADALDAEFVATGHYARVVRRHGRAHLARAVNRAKDQSYVLFGIQRADLGRCLFPLGEMGDKAEVRRLAADLGLRVHDKPDSQEICFVPNGAYQDVVRARRPDTQRPGEVRDAQGRVLGRHDGIANFTIGQRRGLGIATGQPAYVTMLDVLDNIVTLGPREELLAPGLLAANVNWLTDPPASDDWRPAEIKIRHLHTPAGGRLRLLPAGNVEVRFDAPQTAVTPGQAAVFYEDEIVLGGGWIEKAL